MAGVPNWGVPVGTAAGPDGRVCHYATAAAPRVQMWQSGRLLRDFFAYLKPSGSPEGFGANCSYTSEGNLLVMPAAGGGPHLKVYGPDGGLVSESLRGHADDRRGFVPVAVEVQPPVLSAGSGFPVYLSFEGRRPAAFAAECFNELARLVVPLGVRLTTTRPNLKAAYYGQVIFDYPPQPGFGGLFPGPRWDSPRDLGWEVRAVYLMPTSNAKHGAVRGAHEMGHAFGIQHRAGPGTVMSENAVPGSNFHADDAAAFRAGVARAVALG